jgi:hypothetical protein
MGMDKNQFFVGGCCGLGKLWVECGVNEWDWWVVGSEMVMGFRYGCCRGSGKGIGWFVGIVVGEYGLGELRSEGGLWRVEL